MDLYFITSNKHKFNEIKAEIPDIKHLKIDLPEIQEIDPKKIIEYKLKHGLAHKKGSFIVEDVSFEMEALNGLPGPFVKWFLKAMGPEGLYKITQATEKNGARATATIGLVDLKGEIHFFEGEVSGRVVEPRVDNGFGWDRIFIPEGFDKTFSEMSIEDKNPISHRGKAVKKLKEFLNSEST